MFITCFSIVSRRKIKEVNSVLALTLYFFLTPDFLTDQNQVIEFDITVNLLQWQLDTLARTIGEDSSIVLRLQLLLQVLNV